MQGARRNPQGTQERGKERLGVGALVRNYLAAQWARAETRVLQRRLEEGAAPEPPAPRRNAETGTEVNAAKLESPAESAGEACELPAGAAAAWPLAKRAFKEFGQDNGTLMAAAVAFYIMLSLVPMVMVAVAIFGYVLGNAQASRAVMEFVQQFFPAQRELIEGAITAVKEARGTIGLLGLGTLLFTATGGFATLETAINVQWRAPNRNFIWSKVFAFLMLFVVGALLVLSLGITWVIQWAGKIPPLRWMEERWVVQVLGYVLPVLISGLMFTAIYKLFPNVKVSWRPALIAGFITAALWEVFKLGYAAYSTNIDQGATYGTMGSFVGLILWIYYSCALLLLGSELAWVLQGCPKGKEAAPKETPKSA